MSAMSLIEAPIGAKSLAVAAQFGGATDGALSALGQLLAHAVSSLDRDHEAARQSLSQAVALLEGECEAGEPDCAGLAPWQLKRALAHIDTHLDATIRIGDLARLVRLSTSYFSRAFKASLGKSPQKFIVDRRIARAQQFMLTTDGTLCDIAGACGFADQAHMSRAFRRITGATPNAWRRARRSLPTPFRWQGALAA